MNGKMAESLVRYWIIRVTTYLKKFQKHNPHTPVATYTKKFQKHQNNLPNSNIKFQKQ